ncbi:MAG TPA: YfhO family protein, partial [Chryseolinea sp.]|nr:YfhO family protein [Chryseolinea sp.]
MKKIDFVKDVLPHCIAIAVFLIVTFSFFNPVFLENKALNQQDIQQWEGSSKSMRDYRERTGDEPLWSESMFSGMPGYLVSVEWGNKAVGYLKSVLAFKLPHPICNIYLAFLCYYIMLCAFGIRPYLAIAGALAFGLSSYMIIGLSVGHSSRIGAIAFMPLVMAGIHLAFTDRRILGFAVTAAGLALHFRENHLQMTYYLLMIVVVYGLIQLILFVRAKKAVDFAKSIAVLIPAVLIAVGTFFGPMWAITEYTSYSRGKSELTSTQINEQSEGVGKTYAFQYNYAILEPMTLLIPNFYGGSSGNFLVSDQESNVYKALARSKDEQLANQLINYTSAYWGPQTPVPYYAGAIVVFLFVLGIAFAEQKYVWWLAPIVILAVMMSWGSNFAGFNYVLFDYLPGYNKFRSVTFTVVMVIFSMSLLGLLGLEKIMTTGLTKESKTKLLVVFGATGGICLLFVFVPGILSFMREGDEQHPAWFMSALVEDRKALLRSDAFRSLVFIAIAFGAVYFELWKKVSPLVFYLLLIILVTLDIAIVDTRYFTKDNYKRKRESAAFPITEADQEILKDTSYYRVYNIDPQEGAFLEARTSYFHHSVGGYHGVKLRRYQDLYDSCLYRQTFELYQALRAGSTDFSRLGAINMLNIKYMVYGPQRDNLLPNPSANGNAWFVNEIVPANTPNEELAKVCAINTRNSAVVNSSEFKVENFSYDSTATITLTEHAPNLLKYQSTSQTNGLAVFSEIYYPKGWVATIDGKEAQILRANYVLRALQVPSGNHTIEFKFQPKPYVIGNKVTTASSWLLIVVVLASIGWTL